MREARRMLALGWCCLWLGCVFRVLPAGAQESVPIPRVMDERLEISLVADSSQIVHPIGIDVDAAGRLLAIESHTHFPPDNYQGLGHDRILAMEDKDRDGRVDQVSTFYEGTKHTMDLAVHFDGTVLVATRNEIFRLEDTTGDGKADKRKRLVYLETKGTYPHNGLSGLNIDFDGNLYFGMGENLGVSYALKGSDGVTIRDEAEGGNLFWCAADGSRLRRVATGFWNPFGVCRDLMGNVFAIDNDPSANGCRLLHVIEGGNYGYHYRYGRSGLHPFIAWRGELPGTLPVVCPTGEAPCELICYQAAGLPGNYRGTLLSACWSEHQIQQYQLKPSGASFQADRSVVVQGGEDFRPVGMAVAADGSIFITDWVKRDYKLHGHGRIWHLRRKGKQANPGDPTDLLTNRALREANARQLLTTGESSQTFAKWLQPGHSQAAALTAIDAFGTTHKGRQQLVRLASQATRDAAIRAAALRRFARTRTDSEPVSETAVELAESVAGDSQADAALRLASLPLLTQPKHLETLVGLLESADPFLQSAAITQLSQHPNLLDELQARSQKHSGAVRARLLLAHRRSGKPASPAIGDALQDPDATVRFLALKWVADQKIAAFEPQVTELLSNAQLDTRLFLAAATALERIAGRSGDEAKVLQRLLPQLDDNNVSPETKALILRGTPAPGELRRANKTSVKEGTLAKLLNAANGGLVQEAIWYAAAGATPQQSDELLAIAANESAPPSQRRSAVLGLARHAKRHRDRLVQWAQSPSHPLAREARQALVGMELTDSERKAISNVAPSKPLSDIGQQLDRLRGRPLRKPAFNTQEAYWLKMWKQRGEQGDAEAGRRVFHHGSLVKCASCHQVDGRGSMVGPDLSQLARQSSPEQIIESIVSPNKRVAPHYAAWRILTDDGTARTGFLIYQTEQDQTFYDDKGSQFTLKNEQIVSSRALSASVMPTGLLSLLTDQEAMDLFAFLASRK